MQTLQLRKTNKYVGTYRHLDMWEDIGTIETLSERVVSVDDEDPCEYTTTEMTVRIRCDEVTANEQVELAIRDTLNVSGCAHEWDCCGCWSTYVSKVERVGEGDKPGDGTFTVTTSSSRNY